MFNRKKIGSYYTPKIVADFITERIFYKIRHKKFVNILEPSGGDGIFVNSILENDLLNSITREIIVVEREKTEVEKINKASKVKAIHSDFLDYQKNTNEIFSLVIGNPPYIKKNYLSKHQIKLCSEIHEEAQLSNKRIKNIWTSFLIRSVNLLDKEGIIALVLPADFLQVKYAQELREYIRARFDRVEIFTFDELLFKDSKGQNTIVLIAEKMAYEKGVFNCNITDINSLSNLSVAFSENIKVEETKWNHHLLNSEEISLLHTIKQSLHTIDHYCTSKVGITTAANDFFIVDGKTVDEFSMQKYVKPIIQRGAFVNGSVVLTKKYYNSLIRDAKPTFLISIDDNSVIRKNQKIKKYLDQGEEIGIHRRYKMSHREIWYHIPNIGHPADGFFLKRCHEYPKIVKNEAKMLITDCGYNISMFPGYNINSLIYSFYNSLTLSIAELEGRYYGGGVLELTPNEFKKVSLPYIDTSNLKFTKFSQEFESKTSIDDILLKNDQEILQNAIPALDNDTLEKIRTIRKKLATRRTKK